MSWHAKPSLPLIGLPWQHSNASQCGWVFVPRKAVLIWHKHVMDNLRCAPEHTSPTMVIFEHVHVCYRFIYRRDQLVHRWALRAENFKRNHYMSPHKMLSNLYPKCPKCLWSSALVFKPVQHVVKMLLVPNGTGCLIKTLRDCSCQQIGHLELRGIFLLACEFFEYFVSYTPYADFWWV